MKDFISNLYNKENNEELYVFNVTHTFCIIGALLLCGVVRFVFKDIRAMYLTFGILAFYILTMVEGNRTLKLRRSIILMSVGLNFIYMPLMYYLSGMDMSVMPIYFMFGIMYSVLQIKPKYAAILGTVEIVFYSILLTFGRSSALYNDNVVTSSGIYYSGTIIALITVGVFTGCILRFRFIFYDLANAAAEKLESEAMDAYIAKDMFLINTSHEIRTPMNAIVGNVDLLLDQDVSEKVSEDVYNILNSCNALLSITDELMDLSRSETGEVDLFVSTYDLSELLMEVINMMTVRLTESNIGFFVDINSNIPKFLYGDSSKIRQLFVNLLNNAVKFTPKGRISMRVDYRPVSHETIELIVDIEDTGIGIMKEEIGSLFKRSGNKDTGNKADAAGSGLGLSICADIVNEMDGEISVKSEYRSGSVFTFKIPQRFTSMDTIAYIPESDRIRILVFEKDEEYSGHMMKVLASLNLAADIARNEQDLERLMNVGRYDYVFVANERDRECRNVFANRLISEKIVALCNISDNVLIPEASTVLTRPVHILNIAALVRNETNSYVRDITQKGGFECPAATLLVVDDNYTNLNVASAILEKYNANVLTALSGMDCLRIIGEQDVDMVFLDYMMPEMNGIDTLEKIRQIPGSRIASMPVIALTANVVGGAREMFLEAGFDDFMAKPVSIDKMEKMLRKYLRRDLIVPKNPAGSKRL